MFIFRSERFIKKHHPDISRPSCWGSLLELPMVKPGIQEVPEPPAVAALEEDPYVFQVLKSSPNADVTFFLCVYVTTIYYLLFLYILVVWFVILLSGSQRMALGNGQFGDDLLNCKHGQQGLSVAMSYCRRVYDLAYVLRFKPPSMRTHKADIWHREIQSYKPISLSSIVLWSGLPAHSFLMAALGIETSSQGAPSQWPRTRRSLGFLLPSCASTRRGRVKILRSCWTWVFLDMCAKGCRRRYSI